MNNDATRLALQAAELALQALASPHRHTRQELRDAAAKTLAAALDAVRVTPDVRSRP